MTREKIAHVLSIAGSDPSGGAGIQADLKTIAALGGYGMAVITALTAQNTKGVQGVEHVPPDFIKAQIQSIFDDIKVDAIKIGMIGAVDATHTIADVLRAYKDNGGKAFIVLDPVMVATSGDALSNDESVKALVERLVPLADIVTPNIPEAEALGGRKFNGDLNRLADEVLEKTGAHAVYLKGGHNQNGSTIDDLYMDHGQTFVFSYPRIETKNTHGTGCTLSSAIATHLALEKDIQMALNDARRYVDIALRAGVHLEVGQGCGPLHHSAGQIRFKNVV